MDLEHRQQQALRRIYQADRMLQADGQEPEQFVLICPWNGRSIIRHPRWNSSWATPSEETIDDLAELDLLRVELPSGHPRTFTRAFSFTVRGRNEAQAIEEQVLIPQQKLASAPVAADVLRWLVGRVERDPSALDDPASLLDAATGDGVVSAAGADALASRILALVDEGYLQGDVAELEHATATQRLARTKRLQLSVKATDLMERSGGAAPPGAAANIFVTQVAFGNIANFVTFADVLERASDVVDSLTDDSEQRTGAKRLLDQMLGRAPSATASFVNVTAAAVAASAIAHVLGFG